MRVRRALPAMRGALVGGKAEPGALDSKATLRASWCALATIEAHGCRAPSPELERVERRLMAAVLGVVEMENQRIA